MGIKSLSVVLISPSGSPSFYAGSTVNGKVIIYVEKTTHVKTLELKVKGKALVYWSETHLDQREFIWETGRHHHRRIHIRDEPVLETDFRSAQEKYFSSIVPLMVDSVLPVGTREVNFSFTLPSNIPSSYKGHHGQIRYTAVATVHTDHRFIFGGQHKSKIEFPVISPVDLNCMPQARHGVAKYIKHNFYHLVISAGTFTMTASLVHSGFVPGRPLHVSIEAENHSSVTIHGLLFILKEEITYTTQRSFSHSRSSLHELTRHQGEGVMCNTTCSRSYTIHIPQTMHGDISRCQLMSARYFLEIEGLVHGLHTTPVLILEPLYLGSIPMAQNVAIPARAAGSIFPSQPVVQSFPARPIGVPSYPAQSAMERSVPSYPAQRAGGVPVFPAQPAVVPGYPAQPAVAPRYPSQPAAFPAQPGGCVPGYPGQSIPSMPSGSVRPGIVPGRPPMYPNLPCEPARTAGYAPLPPYRAPGSVEPPPPYNPSAPAMNMMGSYPTQK